MTQARIGTLEVIRRMLCFGILLYMATGVVTEILHKLAVIDWSIELVNPNGTLILFLMLIFAPSVSRTRRVPEPAK